jgi:hypothetical protein
MKVLSRDVYRLLREAVGPELKSAGFKRLKSGMLGWTRPSGDHHLTMWFQCDQFGWWPDLGSKFTLEFQLAREAAAGSPELLKRDRFCSVLTGQEREEVLVRNNNIVRNLPVPGPTNPVNFLTTEARKSFMSAYQPRDEPYPPNYDVWLYYASPTHVTDWGNFFSARIVRMAQEFEHVMSEPSGAS